MAKFQAMGGNPFQASQLCKQRYSGSLSCRHRSRLHGYAYRRGHEPSRANCLNFGGSTRSWAISEPRCRAPTKPSSTANTMPRTSLPSPTARSADRPGRLASHGSVGHGRNAGRPEILGGKAQSCWLRKPSPAASMRPVPPNWLLQTMPPLAAATCLESLVP